MRIPRREMYSRRVCCEPILCSDEAGATSVLRGYIGYPTKSGCRAKNTKPSPTQDGGSTSLSLLHHINSLQFCSKFKRALSIELASLHVTAESIGRIDHGRAVIESLAA